MAADLSPAAVARMHVLDRMAEAAMDLAGIYQRALPDARDDANRAYLTAMVEQAQKLAARLRSSAGAG